MLLIIRYQSLATSTDEKVEDTNSPGKRLAADWVLGLGEQAFHLEVIQGNGDDISSKIVVLGTKNLLILHHTGVLIFCKKLDFPPVTMLCYPSGSTTKKLQMNFPISAIFSFVTKTSDEIDCYRHANSLGHGIYHFKMGSTIAFYSNCHEKGAFHGLNFPAFFETVQIICLPFRLGKKICFLMCL